MGFADGLRAGTRASNSWIRNYKEAKEKDIEDSMYEAATQLQGAHQAVDAEGNAIEQEALDFATMDPGKLTNAILERAAQNGVKINDDVYKVAWGVGAQLGGMQQKYALFQDKKEKLDAATSNIYNTIANRNKRTAYLNAKPYYKPTSSGGGDGSQPMADEPMGPPTLQTVEDQKFKSDYDKTLTNLYGKKKKYTSDEKKTAKHRLFNADPEYTQKYGYTPPTSTKKKSKDVKVKKNSKADDYFAEFGL